MAGDPRQAWTIKTFRTQNPQASHKNNPAFKIMQKAFRHACAPVINQNANHAYAKAIHEQGDRNSRIKIPEHASRKPCYTYRRR